MSGIESHGGLLRWTDHGPMVGWGIQINGKWLHIRVGWGWDEDFPLRPWPASFGRWDHFQLGRTMERWRYDWCAAWLGFYVGYSKGRWFYTDPRTLSYGGEE